MQLSTILSLECTKSAIQCTSKKNALEIISQLAAQHLKQDAVSLFECMLNREKMGSTGIGNGIAIPHARITSSTKAVAVLIQCQEPIEFDAIDNRPVDLLFALFVPEEQCKEHLKTLSCMAERLNDKAVLKALRAAQTDQELYDIMTAQSDSGCLCD